MFSETEFKYLTANNEWKNSINRSVTIDQAYLNETAITVEAFLCSEKGAIVLKEWGTSLATLEMTEDLTEAMREAINPDRDILNEFVARMRIVHKEDGGKYSLLSIKERTQREDKMEFELSVPLDLAQNIIEKHPNAVISKTRNYVMFDGNEWEIDCFHGDIEGLVVAEVEVQTRPEVLPKWIGEEVTYDKNYSNHSLLTNGTPSNYR